MKTPLLLITLAAFAAAQLRAADTGAAVNAVNALGIDLLKKTGKPGDNALLSPYSIQEALAMTYAGADGKTRMEMESALHFPKDEAELNKSFAALQAELDVIREQSEIAAKQAPAGKPKQPIALIVANRLFGQSGFEFRKPFLDLLNDNYKAPLQELDFAKEPGKSAQTINGWIAGQTNQLIPDLIPDGALDTNTRLVLANAVYLKAPWNKGFKERLTKPGPFHIHGGKAEDVPLMQGFDMWFGYAKREGYEAIAIPYTGSRLQFLILLPEKVDGLPALQAKLTPELLASCAKLDTILVDLSLPKFKLEPPVMRLNNQLVALGMKTAFDEGADFSRMSPHSLHISAVFHKCFLSVDENGTEATAATAVSAALSDGEAPAKIQVDRPFIFAIQDRLTGACLFIGRVTDPRPVKQTKTAS